MAKNAETLFQRFYFNMSYKFCTIHVIGRDLFKAYIWYNILKTS